MSANHTGSRICSTLGFIKSVAPEQRWIYVFVQCTRIGATIPLALRAIQQADAPQTFWPANLPPARCHRRKSTPNRVAYPVPRKTIPLPTRRLPPGSPAIRRTVTCGYRSASILLVPSVDRCPPQRFLAAAGSAAKEHPTVAGNTDAALYAIVTLAIDKIHASRASVFSAASARSSSLRGDGPSGRKRIPKVAERPSQNPWNSLFQAVGLFEPKRREDHRHDEPDIAMTNRLARRLG